MILLPNLLALIGVVWIVLRRGRDERVAASRPARWLRMAGLLLLIGQVAVLALFGLGEIAAGDWSGAVHGLQLALTVGLAVVAFSRPLEGGLALLAASLAVAAALPGLRLTSPAALILAAPQGIAGLLLFLAGRLAGRPTGGV